MKQVTVVSKQLLNSIYISLILVASIGTTSLILASVNASKLNNIPSSSCLGTVVMDFQMLHVLQI